jgi:hypothetical protein
MIIKVYNGQTVEPKEEETVFYIQSKGNNSGRPLKKPIPNCWEVRTLRSVDFEIMYIIFESKILEPFLRGSVIPFLSLRDYKNIIAPIMDNAIQDNKIINEHYLQIRKIEENISHQDKIKALLLQMKKAISNEVYKKMF